MELEEGGKREDTRQEIPKHRDTLSSQVFLPQPSLKKSN